MPRLIDADKKFMELYLNDPKNGVVVKEYEAELVEVVRCKDCIYYGDHGDEEMVCAMMILYPNKPTDYCSLGERREDAETN